MWVFWVVLLLLLAVFCFMLFVFVAWSTQPLWKKTIGKLEQDAYIRAHDLDELGKRQRFYIVSPYTYTVKGRMYQGNHPSFFILELEKYRNLPLDTIRSLAHKYKKDSDVAVYYFPIMPQLSYLESSKRGGILMLLTLSITGILLFAVGYPLFLGDPMAFSDWLMDFMHHNIIN